MQDVQTPQVRQWHIYKITNPNGKVYIGKTCNLKKRFAAYRGLDCKKQHLIYRSLIKYGVSSHIMEVIDTFSSDVSYANGKEIFWIRTYMSHENKWHTGMGLNLCDGGQGTLGLPKTDREKAMISAKNKGSKHTEEAKRKIGEASRGNKYSAGRKHTEEWKIAASKRQIGNKYCLGRKQPTEWVEMIRKINTGSKRTKENIAQSRATYMANNSRIILQYAMDGVLIKEHNAVTLAAKDLGVNHSCISRNLSGKCKTAYGFIFKYKE